MIFNGRGEPIGDRLVCVWRHGTGNYSQCVHAGEGDTGAPGPVTGPQAGQHREQTNTRYPASDNIH